MSTNIRLTTNPFLTGIIYPEHTVSEDSGETVGQVFNYIFGRLREQVVQYVPESQHRTSGPDAFDFMKEIALQRAGGLIPEKTLFGHKKPTTGQVSVTEMNPIARISLRQNKFDEEKRNFMKKIRESFVQRFAHFDRDIQGKIIENYYRNIVAFVEKSDDTLLCENLMGGAIYPKDALHLAVFCSIINTSVKTEKMPQDMLIAMGNDFSNAITETEDSSSLQQKAMTICAAHLAKRHDGDLPKACKEMGLKNREVELIFQAHNYALLGAERDTDTDEINKEPDIFAIAGEQVRDLFHALTAENPAPEKPYLTQKKSTTQKKTTGNKKNIIGIAYEQGISVAHESASELITAVRETTNSLLGKTKSTLTKAKNTVASSLDPHPEDEIRGLRNLLGRFLHKKKPVSK